MPVNLVSENDLREALRPHRVGREAFEAGVRAKLETAETQRIDDPLAGYSPFLRNAAAYLPLAILAGCKTTPATVQVARPFIAYKLLSWMAFPAISLFTLFGATVFSVAKIRRIRDGNDNELDDKAAIDEVTRQWWSQHRWSATGIVAATLILGMIGATSLLFLMWIGSFAILLYVLWSLARLGLGNRQVVGGTCVAALFFLGQVAGFAGIGHQEIHFVDPSLMVAIFIGGALILSMTLLYLKKFDNVNLGTGLDGVSAGFLLCILIPLLLWQTHPILWSTGPAQIKRFVESFDSAPFKTTSWHQWEIPAQWAIDSDLNLDLTRSRRLLDKELSREQNPYILNIALRVGLLPANRMGELRDYAKLREQMLAPTPDGVKPYLGGFANRYDWVIRSAVLRNDLSAADRDLMEQRLLGALDETLDSRFVTLEDILRLTQLLNVIGRSIDRDQYRDRVQGLLREFHATRAGAFQLSGGFQDYRNVDTSSWWRPAGAVDSTAYAVELMQIYGIPDGLSINWVRSFLKPMVMRFQNDKWMAAAALDRLNRIPEVTRPTWFEVLYYERTLLAAFVLVGLCFYATFSSPKRKPSIPT